MMEISDISLILTITISIIALVVSILKVFYDKKNFDRQFKANKKILDTQLDTQKKLHQKQLESQKSLLEQQLQVQKDTIEKQILAQREISDKQLKAQLELIGIYRKEISILETGLKEINIKKGPSDWERGIKQQELELKQKKEEWKNIKDIANFVQFITKD